MADRLTSAGIERIHEVAERHVGDTGSRVWWRWWREETTYTSRRSATSRLAIAP